jgi:hypothetical protein
LPIVYKYLVVFRMLDCSRDSNLGCLLHGSANYASDGVENHGRSRYLSK